MATFPSEPVYWDSKAVFADIETALGAGAAAITGANAVRLWDVNWTPLDAEKKVLPYAKPTFGANPSILLNAKSKLSFKIGLVGGGTTGIPCWDVFVRAAGAARQQVMKTANATIAAAAVKTSGTGTFIYARTTPYTGVHARTATLTCTTGGGTGVAAFTVSAPELGSDEAYEVEGVVMTTASPFALPGGAVITPSAIGTAFVTGDVFTIALTPAGSTYTPLPFRAGQKSIEVVVDLPDPEDADKVQYWRMLGGRCTLKGSGTADDYPYLEFEVTADYASPTVVDEIVPDYSAYPDPLVVSDKNTVLRRLFGQDVVLDSFGFDAGFQVDYVSRPGRKGARKSGGDASFTAKIEAPSIATVNFFDLCTSRATGAFLLQHGPAPGTAVVLKADRWQLDPPKPGESKKDFMYDLSGAALPTGTGGDDWSLFASAT